MKANTALIVLLVAAWIISGVSIVAAMIITQSLTPLLFLLLPAFISFFFSFLFQ